MAETRRRQVAAKIEEGRISAIIRADDQGLAARAMEAAVDGGFRIVEFTLTTPGALELIAQFSKRVELTVGAGTVMTPSQACDAVSAGAVFLVSPICDPQVVAKAASLDVPSFPGAYTPTEIVAADRLGADFIKVFPAPCGGADFIRALRGPLPHLRLFPTAGVTPENFVGFLDAGCVGAGFVHSLFEPADVAAGNLAAIRERAGAIVKRLADWRSVRMR